MMESFALNDITRWFQESLVLSLLLVFIAALTESLAIVGLIMPGAIIMVFFGAMIGMEILPFWPVTIAAILGAILGDSLSYGFGRRYRHRLRALWPFTRYPEMLDRGIAFFEQHGGKSVALGRFVGPLRAVIPLVAGMLDMPRLRFLLTNVLSALAWAPLYLLPGYIFGLSLEIASEFAGRFLMLLVILVIAAWFAIFVLRQIYLWLVPYLDYLLWRLVMWSGRHPVAGKIPAAIVSPAHPEIRGLSLMTLFLVLSSLVFSILYQTSSHLTFIDNINDVITHNFYTLHNPPFNSIMAAFASLGEITPVLVCVGVTLIWLLWQRYWLAIGHLFAAVLFPLLLALAYEISMQFSFFHLDKPDRIFFDRQFIFALSTYGFLAIILVREIHHRWHKPLYLALTLFLIMIAISRLYLGIDLFSKILGEIALGLIWLSILGIAYRRHLHQTRHARYGPPLILFLFLFMLIYPGFNHTRYHPEGGDSQTYVMSKTAWLESGWTLLPERRNDLRKQFDFPMTIQWAGQVHAIQQQLKDQGWEVPDYDFLQFLQWLNADATIKQLPILPHLHDGRYESLQFVKYLSARKRIVILRLWQSGLLVQDTNTTNPIWIGNLSYLAPVEKFGLRYLQTQNKFPDAEYFLQSIQALQFIHRQEKTVLIFE